MQKNHSFLKRHRTLNLLISLLFLIACDSSINTGNVIQIKIDSEPQNTKFSELFKSEFDLIHLENNSESQVGIVRKTVLFQNLIFILDNTNTIFIFKNSGEYVNKLHKVGKGPKEYIMIMSFLVTESENGFNILVHDPVNREIIKYDERIEFIEKLKCQFPFYDFEYQKKNYVYYRGLMTGTPKQYEYDLIIKKQDNEDLDKYLQYKYTNLKNMPRFPLIKVPHGILFHTNYNDTVYLINSNFEMIPEYKIQFPGNKFPLNSYLIENKDNSNLSKEIFESDKIYSYVFNKLEDKILISFYSEKTRFLYIQNQKGRKILTNNYIDDFGLCLSNQDIDFFYEDRLGFIIYPYQIFKEKKNSNSRLHPLLNQISEEENPVVAILRLKDLD